MNTHKIHAPFFHILSCIIRGAEVDWEKLSSFNVKDWERLYLLSKAQGIVAVVFDKVKDTPKRHTPPRNMIFKWFSHSLAIEQQMKKKEAVAVEFAEKLSERGIKTAVLKGLAYASYYPNPYHRESGDLDCYLMGQKELGDKVTIEIGGRMEEAGYKHSHLYYKGLTIENHRFLIRFNNTSCGKQTERLLEQLIQKNLTPIGNTKLLNPSADFNALFLLKHAQRHFIHEGIRIRHLLDWVFFLKAESANVNWDNIIPMMSACRILNFAKVITSICSDCFGGDFYPQALMQSDSITQIVLRDILGEQPNIHNETSLQKFKRIIRRFRRMWTFRSLADESYSRMVWNSFAFSSYLNRRPEL